jgi:peptide/nickel transport system permease protein
MERELMRGYLIKRIIIALAVIYIIATLNFVIFQVVAPVDPVEQMIGPSFTPEMIQNLYQEFGLNEPITTRYLLYIKNIFSWNFGYSFASRTSIAAQMSWRMAYSVILLGTALVAQVAVGIPVGILAASKRGTKTDVIAIGTGLFTWGVPTFFIQLILLLTFAYYTKEWFGSAWFPIRGAISDPAPTNPIAYVADFSWHLALPALSLVLAGFGGWALTTRNLLLESLTQDFVTTARAKGLSERAVLYRHAFRSTLPPIVTLLALSVPALFTGAIITEQIFTYPGMGHWYIASLAAGDYPVLQSVLFIYAVLMVAANLIADLIYGALDPRIRVGTRR